MNKFIFDAGPLITACKFNAVGRLVIDHLLEHCEITIAASVHDAQVARQRIDRGQIAVLSPPSDPALEA